jgi:hypothetical protein
VRLGLAELDVRYRRTVSVDSAPRVCGRRAGRGGAGLHLGTQTVKLLLVGFPDSTAVACLFLYWASVLQSPSVEF